MLPLTQLTLFYRYALLILAVSAGSLLLIAHYSLIDLHLADYYFDRQHMVFPWRDAWLTNTFAHGWLKNIIVGLGVLILAVVLVDIVFSIKSMSQLNRLRLRFVAASALLVPACISVMKHFSFMHCPWDIDRYGGYAPYINLLERIPDHIKAGHCFPAGHASTGLWLASLAIFCLPQSPKKAAVVFMTGLCAGLLLGWTQQMRGAHFLTHTLWSIWIASALILALFAFFFGGCFRKAAFPQPHSVSRL